MKRALFALGLLACGDQPITRGLEEPLAVHDAQFIEGPLPGSPEQPPITPRPTSATTEVTSLRPGLPNVAFSGWATLDAVSVAAQIEGQGDGHWVLPAGAPDPSIQGEPVRVWRFVADLHDSLPPGKHRMLVAATDAAGRTGSQFATTICVNRLVPDNGNACDPTKAPPEFVVSLAWDRPVDLDLIVVTPSSEIVSANSPRKGAGVLDRDSNADCRIDGRQLENVVFQDRPAPGSYLVYANLHDACREESVRYTASRHTRAAGGEPGTFTVVETDKTVGTLTAIQANGNSSLGTFIAELFVQ